MTLLDYPDKVAATVFTLGCPFRCHYCHNPELVLLNDKQLKILTEEEVFNFLRSRRKLLDALCVTGGEPTLHKELPEFLARVKELGLLVKLDTNGTNPAMLKKLISKNLIDYIAMDIKAPWDKYSEVVGKSVNLEKLQESVKIIIESGLPHEFRSTVLPRLHTAKDILAMAKQVKGGRAYFIQQFRPAEKMVNPEYTEEKKFTLKDLEEIRRTLKEWFEVSGVR